MGNLITSIFFQEDIEEFNALYLNLNSGVFNIKIKDQLYKIPYCLNNMMFYLIGRSFDSSGKKLGVNYITQDRYNSNVTIYGLINHIDSIVYIGVSCHMTEKIKKILNSIVIFYLHNQINIFVADSSCDRIFNSLQFLQKKNALESLLSYEQEFSEKYQFD